MTCIAVIKNKHGNLIMAGDRRITEGNFIQVSVRPKVVNKGSVLMAFCGDAGIGLNILSNAFKVPEKRVKDSDTFMHHVFQPALKQYITKHYVMDNSKLSLPPDTSVDFLVAVGDTAYQVIVSNPSNEFTGHIDICPINTPYATGSGGKYCQGVLESVLHTKGYLTKQDLKNAFEITSKLCCYCDNNVDIISL